MRFWYVEYVAQVLVLTGLSRMENMEECETWRPWSVGRRLSPADILQFSPNRAAVLSATLSVAGAMTIVDGRGANHAPDMSVSGLDCPHWLDEGTALLNGRGSEFRVCRQG
jgi:hypothetical protein